MVDGSRLTVEYWPLASILPYAANARTHPEAQVAQLVDSMRQFGFTQPCLVDAKGELIAGHGRLMAAQVLGLEQVPVIRLGHLTPQQARAYRLADNRIALNSEWDETMLAEELAALSEDFDLEGLGFDAGELDGLLEGAEGQTSGAQDGEDDTPEPEPNPAARLGDVWLCGPHRVVCGDSTDEAAVRAAVGQEKPNLMVTDPPYGVKYDPAWRNGLDKAVNLRTGVVKNDDRADWTDTWRLFPGNVAYVWHGALHASTVEANLLAAGFELRAQIVWAKQNLVLGRGDYHWQHEPAWYVVRKGEKGSYQGDRTQTTLWRIDNLNLSAHQKAENDRTNHSTQKPVECMRRPIVNNSERGDAVYDPFLGSGTTVIAAETEGRRCFGIELNPVYVDVIVKRWEAFTGQQATLEGDGRSFAAVAAERLAQAEAA